MYIYTYIYIYTYMYIYIDIYPPFRKKDRRITLLAFSENHPLRNHIKPNRVCGLPCSGSRASFSIPIGGADVGPRRRPIKHFRDARGKGSSPQPSNLNLEW